MEDAHVGKPEERVATGVDVVGDIAILKLPGLMAAEKRRFAETLMREVRSVKCVYEQKGGIEGEYRLRTLKHLGGEKRTLTLHKENGCIFKVDVARCYFSSRLSTERLLLAEEVRRKERVLNMFAGVGPFSIEIAKRSGARVTSCEINRYACELHLENNRLNKVVDRVAVVNEDASRLPDTGDGEKFDRILMPHPSQANRFLPTALSLVKGPGVIHYYRHVLGRDEQEATAALLRELDDMLPAKARVRTRRVRYVGPRWIEMAADIRLSPRLRQGETTRRGGSGYTDKDARARRM